MFQKIKREIYLLTRAEQRALLSATTLLYVAMLLHLFAPLWQKRPGRYAQEFMQVAGVMLDSIRLAEGMRLADSRHVADSLRLEDSLRLAELALDMERQITGAGPPPLKDRLQSRPLNLKPPNKASGTLPGQGRSAPLTLPPIELNAADSLALLPLPGIGPVLAGRIVKYRRLLGGYCRVEQLREVYGLSAECFERIEGRLEVDSSTIRQLDLNQASFGDLLRHPYLELEHVKALCRYRDFMGIIKDPDELLSEGLLPEAVYRRIRPYLMAD